jgi:small subunit ribosomal protein S1
MSDPITPDLPSSESPSNLEVTPVTELHEALVEVPVDIQPDQAPLPAAEVPAASGVELPDESVTVASETVPLDSSSAAAVSDDSVAAAAVDSVPVVESAAEVVALVSETPISDDAVTDPAITDSVVADSVVTDPARAEVAPDEAEPAASEPAASEPVASEPAVPATDEGGALAYQPGDIIPGKVITVRDDGVDVELDEGRRAVAPKAEWPNGASYAEGDMVEGQVLRRQGAGKYVISMKRALKTRSWTRILAARDSGEVMTGTVTEVVKGGLIVDLGLRAFLPESLIDVRRVGKPGELVGQSVNVLVIEAEKATDRPGERIVVSRKPLREKERAEARSQLIHTIQPGERRRGRVSALVPFGAFVDLGGIDGLIHVSEIAHAQVVSADKVLAVGDEVDVIVLEVNPEKRKIALSRKQALPDPWAAFQSQHQVGDLVFGTITGLAAFGAFVSIEGAELEGLIHISELSRFRVEQASDVVSVGEGVWVQILEIAPDKKRLALSLRRALE